MRHFIIVKWQEPEVMKESVGEIQALFDGILEIPGIESVTMHPSCSDRSNRYDLMIEILMAESSLPDYDHCTPHKLWKERYGEKIAHKVIFDCE